MAVFKRKIPKTSPNGSVIKTTDGQTVYHLSKNWTVDIWVHGKRCKREVGPNKQMALAIENKLKAQEAEGRYLDVLKDRRVPFDQAAKDFLAYSKNNKRSYKRDTQLAHNMLSFFGGVKIAEISPALIENYKAKRLKEGRRPATVNREMAFGKAAINWAIRNGNASDNPFKKVKFMKEDNEILRFLSEDEIKKLVEACPDQLQPVVVMALNTGMRKGEILKLNWEHINFIQGLIMIKAAKGGKSRDIPINGSLRSVLEKLRSKYPGKLYNESPVFLNEDQKPYRKVDSTFQRALKRAEISNFRFHDLRHTAASWMIMSGVDLVTVKEILGHSSLRMTMRYAHLSKLHKHESMEILGSKIRSFLNIQTGTKWEQEAVSKVTQKVVV